MNRLTPTLLAVLISAASPAAHAEEGLITHKALSLDMAMAIAQGALEKCRAAHYQCAVTVLDAAGRTLIALQDDGAMLHRFDVSRKKAYTALVYRRPSKEVVEGWSSKAASSAPLVEGTIPNPPIEGTIDMGGGIPIFAGKEVIGAVAVSGAPGWDMDEAWAKAGLAKVADKLK
jgi:uncharacterized protein GlcG (DUF336 family)